MATTVMKPAQEMNVLLNPVILQNVAPQLQNAKRRKNFKLAKKLFYQTVKLN